MSKSIRWESDLEMALSMARVQEKHVLLDFFNPGWGACRQMDTVTYPEPRTVDFVNHYLIPIRVNTSSPGPLPASFAIQYTPTLILLDDDAKEQHRSVGFQPPEQFVPSMLLEIGKSFFNHNQFSKALAIFNKILADYPRSPQAVTANDLKQVCLTKGAA